MPIIRIDDQVWDQLKERAKKLDLVFEPPNATLRAILGLDSQRPTNKRVDDRQVADDMIEINFLDSNRKYRRIRIPEDKRHFFPGFRVRFQLKTDAGLFDAYLTGGKVPEGALIGDPNLGNRIRGRLGPWLKKHSELKEGDKLRIRALEPGECYELSVIESPGEKRREPNA